MEFLQEIREYEFLEYDKGAIETTKENIAELLSDSEIVWNMWKADGMNKDKEFKIDFDFYSADKEGVMFFSEILRENNFEVVLKTKRFLLFFKGYEVRATLKDYWTLKKLNEKIELLGLFSRKYNLLIEGYGTQLKE